MAPKREDPARHNVAAGPADVLLGGLNNSENSQSRSAAQVYSARKHLLVDFIVEALGVAGHYADTAITFARLGDIDGLELAIREFARTGSLATKSARELIDLRIGGRS